MEMFYDFIDVRSVVAIYTPLFVICVSLWISCKAKWNVLFRDIGVPLGLFFSLISTIGMVENITAAHASAIGPATAIMLLTIIYGCVASAFGHFSTFKQSQLSSQHGQQTSSWKAITLILVPFVGLIVWAMDGSAGGAAGIDIFINPVASSVFGSCVIAAVLLSDSNHRVEVLCQASLLSAMISLVLGLVVLYGSFLGEGLNEGMYEGLSIAMNGLSYGLFSYICIYIVSYKFGTTEKINAPLMNWHWMEVTGFLIFMFFAPETLRESLMH